MNHKEIAIMAFQEIGAELNTKKMINHGWHKVDLGTISRFWQKFEKPITNNGYAIGKVYAEYGRYGILFRITVFIFGVYKSFSVQKGELKEV